MSMNRALHQAIYAMVTQPEGWVRVDSLQRANDGIVLVLCLYAGKRGRRLKTWDIRCRQVREVQICDLDGGGIGLYGPDHPVCRQYSAPIATLRCSLGDRMSAGFGAMMAAHTRVADDWIPFDRYLHAREDPIAVRGPVFIVNAYAAALRELGLAPKLSATRAKKEQSRYRALHFGSSFVVAGGFEAKKGTPRT
jgi:hypothetical protein